MEWQRAVAAAFGLGDVVEPWTPVAGGRSHLMWRLRTSRGTWAVKRLNRSREDWWMRDYLVAAEVQLAAHARGFPMPRPVHPLEPVAPLLADVRVGDEVESYLVHEWHDGGPLTADVTPWVGGTLAALHRLPAGDATEDRPPHPVEEWREWLDESPNDFTEAVRAYLPDVAEALVIATAPAELTPVSTHRDVKPDNVLQTPTGPLLVDWDGAGVEHAEWELARAAVYFSGLGEDRAAFDRVITSYEEAGGRRPAASPTSFAGLLRVYLGGAAWMVWRALGHRPVTPAERAASHTHALELLADLRTSLTRLDDWTTRLR
ncbi:aminoglycoside phosphotransferase family protein [Saccharothrix sp. S26]|uniref:phosphotransferase family protein n=1 Tax=Saccharothrix sp. S26 TaxID=2907215 RepID=UPI001F296DA2|nr:aminoglycoside phosphotransferase family protein [Saccharothrix sp. S26]MCE6995613.1 aminoglycoside phosphotransferase family protein [Saccharothrix sp. S26]